MSKLFCLGELLIDFQPIGNKPLKDTLQFVKNAGGAPANVCVQAVKLGREAAYLTKVGKDAFGDFLIEALKGEGVDTSFITQTDKYDTSLAFVSLGEGGERQFSFYRRTAADLHFTPQDFLDVKIEKGDVFEYGSVALNGDDARSTHEYLIDKASQAGALICFDPNLRFNLWDSGDKLKEAVLTYAKYADVIKVGADELQFLLGDINPFKAFGDRLKVLLVTDGGKGAKVYTRDGKMYSCNGFKVNAVDTTGAGDSFFGGFISSIMQDNATPENILSDVDLQKALIIACKCGAYTTTNYGAIPAMGDMKTIDKAVK